MHTKTEVSLLDEAWCCNLKMKIFYSVLFSFDNDNVNRIKWRAVDGCRNRYNHNFYNKCWHHLTIKKCMSCPLSFTYSFTYDSFVNFVSLACANLIYTNVLGTKVLSFFSLSLNKSKTETIKNFGSDHR